MPDGHPLLPGDPAELGGNRLLRRLGEGSQGVVYLGRDSSGAPSPKFTVELIWANGASTGQSASGVGYGYTAFGRTFVAGAAYRF